MWLKTAYMYVYLCVCVCEREREREREREGERERVCVCYLDSQPVIFIHYTDCQPSLSHRYMLFLQLACDIFMCFTNCHTVLFVHITDSRPSEEGGHVHPVGEPACVCGREDGSQLQLVAALVEEYRNHGRLHEIPQHTGQGVVPQSDLSYS